MSKMKTAWAALGLVAALMMGSAPAQAEQVTPAAQIQQGQMQPGQMQPPSQRPGGFTQEQQNSLTQAQKEELYALQDQADALQVQLIDKYFSLGLIDQATADQMKANILAETAALRESGSLPSIMSGGFRGGMPAGMERPIQGSINQ